MKYYAVEYGGYWKIQIEDNYEGDDLLDADSVGEEQAEKNAKMIIDLLNRQHTSDDEIEKYIWEHIPVKLSYIDRLRYTENYQLYEFVIDTIKYFRDKEGREDERDRI